MGLFKRNEEVPSIPSSPTLATFPSPNQQVQEKSLPELPAFPQANSNENLNQEMVKSAVTDQHSPGEEEVINDTSAPAEGQGLIPSVAQEPQMDSRSPIFPNPQPQALEEISSEPISSETQASENSPIPATPIPISTSTTPHETPIFVRVDKFQEAQESFSQIKTKLDEIEGTLSRIKDTKDQEDKELEGWKAEIEKLKNRLQEIDQDIFNQI